MSFNNFSLIEGGYFQDERGEIRFFNKFSMSQIKRMYIIEHNDLKVIRAWQAHKREQKWLYAMEGSFIIKLIFIDNWLNPSRELKVESIELSHLKNHILHIPSGYANGFQALEKHSKLLVFSDLDIIESSNDDFRFEKDFWQCW